VFLPLVVAWLTALEHLVLVADWGLFCFAVVIINGRIND
jgi:hypothetical protein